MLNLCRTCFAKYLITADPIVENQEFCIHSFHETILLPQTNRSQMLENFKRDKNITDYYSPKEIVDVFKGAWDGHTRYLYVLCLHF